jgi:hypothetical protein
VDERRKGAYPIKVFQAKKQRNTLMTKHVSFEEKNPFGKALEEVLREGARKFCNKQLRMKWKSL